MVASIYTNYVARALVKTGLSEGVAYRLSGQVSVKSHEEGDVIYIRGQEVNAWCFVINGSVAACVKGAKGCSQLTQIFPSGSWFGEQSIINHKPSYSDFICLSGVDILKIPAEAFHEVYHTEKDFMNNICKLLAWREQIKGEILSIHKAGGPQHKIALCLAYLVEAIVFNGSRPTGTAHQAALLIESKQNFVASFCGVSRPVFSNFIQHLVNAGFLKVHYGSIEFYKISAWLRLAFKIRKNHSTIQDFVENSALDELAACEEDLPTVL